MWVSRYFVWFCLFGVLGWVWETIFCTVKERAWQNRGFLFGPICPIYGVGAVVAIATVQHIRTGGVTPAWWQIFLFAMVGSAVLEYVTSWALEHFFHARWWDYSRMPLNLNGRICLPASLLFGLAGLGIVYGLLPTLREQTSQVSPIAIETTSLVAMALLAADTALTVSSLTRFAQIAAHAQQSVNEHMERFVAEAVDLGDQAIETARERKAFQDQVREAHARVISATVKSAVRRVATFPSTLPEPTMLQDLKDHLDKTH